MANEFKPTYESTLGAAFMAKTINYNDLPVKFQVRANGNIAIIP